MSNADSAVINNGGFIQNNHWYTVNSGFFPTIPSLWGLPVKQLNIDYELDSYKTEDSTKRRLQLKIKVGNSEGYECDECKEYCPMAELNSPEGAKYFTSFICYSCRNGLKTLYKKEGNT